MTEKSGNCTQCGACCATFPVLFGREELDSEPGGWVPAGLAEPYLTRCAHMCGTTRAPRRCVALEGTIGVEVRCSIYVQRPSPCRDFAPQADAGGSDPRCGDARRAYGLLPFPGSYDAFPMG